MCTRSNKHRHSAYLNQSGRCYYCDLPMWEDFPEVFAEMHKISVPQATSFQCTAEHLKAKKDGGRNAKRNIVAACLYCNQTRHRSKIALNHEDYKRKVQQRLGSGRWHIAVKPMQSEFGQWAGLDRNIAVVS